MWWSEEGKDWKKARVVIFKATMCFDFKVDCLLFWLNWHDFLLRSVCRDCTGTVSTTYTDWAVKYEIHANWIFVLHTFCCSSTTDSTNRCAENEYFLLFLNKYFFSKHHIVLTFSLFSNRFERQYEYLLILILCTWYFHIFLQFVFIFVAALQRCHQRFWWSSHLNPHSSRFKMSAGKRIVIN